jgi:hypothetical protein
MVDALVTILMDIYYVIFGFPEHTGELLQALFGGFFGFFEGIINFLRVIFDIFG